MTHIRIDSRIGVADTHNALEKEMSRGSKRITVRLGDCAIEKIGAICVQLNARPGASCNWTLSEFVVRAVIEKLNHIQRGRGKKGSYNLSRDDESDARQWREEGDD